MVGIILDLASRGDEKVRLCGMRLISCLLLVCISACSKKKEDAPAPAPASAAGSTAAVSGSDSGALANPVPPAPKLTTERFFKEQYSSFLATSRGVVLVDGDNPPEHLCGPAIGTAMVRLGKIATKAKDTSKPEDCKARGAYTYCTFTLPESNAKGNPDSTASYVFTNDEPPVLIAVLIGTAVAKANQFESEIGKPRECKRE
jgi:hypothetical protein